MDRLKEQASLNASNTEKVIQEELMIPIDWFMILMIWATYTLFHVRATIRINNSTGAI